METKTGEPPKISRREVLRQGLFVGISSTALSATYLENRRTGRTLFPDRKERYLTQSPDGYQIAMISGIHDGDYPQVTPIKIEDLYEPVGALFPDAVDDYLDPGVQAVIPRMLSETAQTRGKLILFEEPIDYALENKIPIIFGDLTLRGFSLGEFIKQGAGVPNKWIASLGILPFIEPVLGEKISRRGLLRQSLKILGGAGALGAAYFSSFNFVDLARAMGFRPDSELGRDFQTILTDIIHPQEFVVVMRNIIWALKGIDYYQMGLVPKDKIINIVGGLGHRFWDFFVRHPDLAKKYWEIFNYKKLASEFAGGDPSWVYQSYILRPPNSGEVITHENLKKLAV